MSKVTIYTPLLNERDKRSAEKELFKGNTVCIYPTCINAKRTQTLVEESEEFFKSLGAVPIEIQPETESALKQTFWAISSQEKIL